MSLISIEDSSSEEDIDLVVQCSMDAIAAAVASSSVSTKEKKEWRHLPRSKRKKYDHARALKCIKEDYLNTIPRFDWKEFITMFRVSRSRFQVFLEDFAEDPFFKATVDCFGNPVASLEAKLLLPLKTLAFGVGHHCFRDYFQMSRTMARDCVINFCTGIKKKYQKEYLRLPTPLDLKAITNLHQHIHAVPGMFGSLDCMHVYWKNCPVAWQGQFKSGHKALPSLVLEGLCDHHMFFWHSSFGYAGSLNDLNIMNLSPLLESLKDGSFKGVERAAMVTPFIVDGEVFKLLYITTDGIYPNFARFVKGKKEPILPEEKIFSDWLASARKDIERAFGVLQLKFQVMARPMHSFTLEGCCDIASCCLILHNMCVSDRIMGDPKLRYRADHSLDREVDEVIEYPEEFHTVAQALPDGQRSRFGIQYGSELTQSVMIRRNEWEEATDGYEHARLKLALTRLKVKQYNSFRE